MKPRELTNKLYEKLSGGEDFGKNLSAGMKDVVGIFLVYNLNELLKKIELMNWIASETPDVFDAVRYRKGEDIKKLFSEDLSLFDDIEEVQYYLDNIFQINANIYYVYLIAVFEKFLNFMIDVFFKKNISKSLPRKKETRYKIILYDVDDEGDLTIKINEGTPKKIIHDNPNTKLWFLHEFIGSKKPNPRKRLVKSDFEFYTFLRNQILHRDEHVDDLNQLHIYSDHENEISNKDGMIEISSDFFYMAMENLFDICLEIAEKFEEAR